MCGSTREATFKQFLARERFSKIFTIIYHCFSIIAQVIIRATAFSSILLVSSLIINHYISNIYFIITNNY